MKHGEHASPFGSFRGEGAAMGYECSLSFKEYEYGGWNGAKILFPGTDGIWETENRKARCSE